MTEYLSYKFHDSEAFVNSFDELPLWSAPFGLLLLKHLELKPNLTIADIGSGTGFPLIELAGRLGTSCKLFGIDPWKNANQRAKQKIQQYALSNVEIIECSAAKTPMENNAVDLIVSNLGIHNFDQPELVFQECNRILKPNGKLVITTNLNGHWKEFYAIFYDTLREIGKKNYLNVLRENEANRGTIESISTRFTENGFRICRYFEESFDMRFLDGSAFLNHHFVKPGWLTSWTALFPKEMLPSLFLALEKNLNEFAQRNNGLTLSVPMLYLEGEKISEC